MTGYDNLDDETDILNKQKLKASSYQRKNIWTLMPVFGSAIFIILYIIASQLYPGGSQIDKNSIGFSWINNYWCNLLNENGINGQPNAARPFAITGMFILCTGLSFFWYLFPSQIKIGRIHKLIIQVSGIIAMSIACFLFTGINHDLIVNLASSFGVVAIIGTLITLYVIRWYALFWCGISCLMLVAVNNYFYYSKELIHYLPLVQKISFAAFICWICCIDVKLYYKIR